MRSNYKKLGPYIKQVNIRNKDVRVDLLLGVSIQKILMPSIANTVGTNMETYKIIEKSQFAYGPVTSRNGDKVSIALLEDFDEAIVSQSYTVFKIIDPAELLPEYLMMWFRRTEFDRYARFKSHGSARETFDWEELSEVELPIPSPAEQQEIVNEFNTVINRIKLCEELNRKLEDTAHTLFSKWFAVGEDNCLNPVELENYIQFNPKEILSKGQQAPYVEMSNLNESNMSIDSYRYRDYKSGTKFKNGDTLFARITPCLENGKTSFVHILPKNKIAFGSTEFIVMRPKEGVSKFWVYCLARNTSFRDYAISSMTGTSGRQRVHTDYLKSLKLEKVDQDKMNDFGRLMKPLFSAIQSYSNEKNHLIHLRDVISGKMTSIHKSIVSNEVH